MKKKGQAPHEDPRAAELALARGEKPSLAVYPRQVFNLVVAGVLAHLRRASGVDQVEFARRAEIPRSTYSRLEAGTARVDSYVLSRVAEALGITPSALHDSIVACNKRAQFVIQDAFAKSDKFWALPKDDPRALEALGGLVRFAVYDELGGLPKKKGR